VLASHEGAPRACPPLPRSFRPLLIAVVVHSLPLRGASRTGGGGGGDVQREERAAAVLARHSARRCPSSACPAALDVLPREREDGHAPSAAAAAAAAGVAAAAAAIAFRRRRRRSALRLMSLLLSRLERRCLRRAREGCCCSRSTRHHHLAFIARPLLLARLDLTHHRHCKHTQRSGAQRIDARRPSKRSQQRERVTEEAPR